MSIRDATKTLEKFKDECIQCTSCFNKCSLLEELGLTPGEIAQRLLDGQFTDELIAAILRCDLCGHCAMDCLVNLDPSCMFIAAREWLMVHGEITPDLYDIMLVDQDWNFFTIYRETYKIHYDDLQKDQYDLLFFPGCTLATYAPELTRLAYQWLTERGWQVGFSEMCCGKPLYSIGLIERERHYLNQLQEQLDKAHVTQVVTACPNCYHHLKMRLSGIKILSLYALLQEAGIQVSGQERLTLHDSCPDRFEGTIGKEIRDLLSGHELVEMPSHGKDAICCGSGGIVSMIEPEICQSRAQRRMSEFYQSGANICVTGCMACAHRLARASRPNEVIHCLELVFNVRVDYAQIEANVNAMWEGEQGEINQRRIAQASKVHYLKEG